MFDLNNTGPVPDDLGTRLVFDKVQVPLGQLIDVLGASGQTLTGRKFVDCVLHGPCVVIPGDKTRLENCNLGDAAGDVRNLFLRAAGPMIVGGVPLNDCVFEGCLFIGVGFAGDDAFVDAFIAKMIPKKA